MGLTAGRGALGLTAGRGALGLSGPLGAGADRAPRGAERVAGRLRARGPGNLCPTPTFLAGREASRAGPESLAADRGCGRDSPATSVGYARGGMESVQGQLLIAGPKLLDPNFWRTVVLVVDHTEEGALGLVLNRPSQTTVREAVSEPDLLPELDETLYVGGPVQPSALIVLAQFEHPGDAALLAFDDVGVLPAGEGRDAPLRRGRAFAGHAGWGPGQLDGELERGDWILDPARHEDAFTDEPLSLWQTVLTRKGGSYALVARMPPDPSVN